MNEVLDNCVVLKVALSGCMICEATATSREVYKPKPPEIDVKSSNNTVPVTGYSMFAVRCVIEIRAD